LSQNDFGFFGNEVIYEKHRSIDKFYRFNTGKFDIWHMTTTLSWYQPFDKKVNLIYTIHDLHFLIEFWNNHHSNKRTLDRIRKRAERADFIVAISQYSLDMANELLPIKNKPQKVIYNGGRVCEVADCFSPRIKPSGPFLFSLGQMYTRKNFHVLPPLLKNNDYQLIIAGLPQTDYGNKVLEEARKYGVSDRVSLIGPISEEEKSWYYKNCLAFLFPSIAEGFGLPVIEAMQFGKPVFLSDQTSLPEIGGTEAYYFENFDPEYMQHQFATCLKNYHDTHPQEKIKQRAKHFSWANCAKAYLDLYKSLA
jgi:glycosyltransferase involved in cell wall biosynthesis